MEHPNGLAFSPDESVLYVSDTSAARIPGGNHHILAFDVVDGGRRMANPRTFVVMEPGFADGLRVDVEGNVWTSAGDGIHVLDPRGVELGRILLPEVASNCVFGGRDGTAAVRHRDVEPVVDRGRDPRSGDTLDEDGRTPMSGRGVHPTLLLYDDECGLYTATAAWLARRVPARRLRLVAVSDVSSQPGVRDLVAGRDLTAALHLVTPPGRVLTGARAVLAAGRLVPRWRALAIPFDQRLGQALLEPVYRLVARRRSAIGRLLGLPASCPIPTAAERPR